MNLALLMRYAPLAPYFGKPASSLQIKDIEIIARALAGDAASELMGPLNEMARANPGTPALELLGTPTALKALERLQARGEDDANTLAARCPHCQAAFLIDMSGNISAAEAAGH